MLHISVLDANIFYQPSKCATQRPYSAPSLRLFHLRRKLSAIEGRWPHSERGSLPTNPEADVLIVSCWPSLFNKSFSNENPTFTIVSEHRCVSGVSLKARRQCTLKVKVPRPACPNASYSLSRRNSHSHVLFMEFTLPLQDMRFLSLNQNVSTIVHSWSHFQGGGSPA